MKRLVSEQINFNTVLLIVVGALVGLGVKKADAAFDSINRLSVHQEDVDRRVENMESVLGIYTPRRRGQQTQTTQSKP